jgi:alpha-glucuronidase
MISSCVRRVLAVAILLMGLACTLSIGSNAASSPYPYRIVWMWEEMDGSLLHIPGAPSFFSSKDLSDPASVPRYVRLAEQLRSMKINGLVVSVSFDDHSFVNVLGQLRALSEFLKRYGIGMYLHVPYGYRVTKSSTAVQPFPNCVYDPAFAKYYNDLADKLFAQVPLLKGYVIKGTGYEGVPGPLSCQCETCKSKTEAERMLEGINVLSRSVAKHNGVIFYRTWMTGALQDREYKLFAALSGKLPKNVYIVSKIGYGDFGIREMPHPLFGHIKPFSQHIAEFQVFGEYRGLSYNPCEMVTEWGKWMRANKNLTGGFIGDIEVGRDSFDHPLNMVNCYGFGRYASDPNASADEIIRTWSEQTYGKKAAGTVADVVKRTNAETWNMMYFKGVWIQQHSWLPPADYLDSHLRGPWADMKRDEKLIGWARPLDLYPADLAAKFAGDPDLELFVGRREITPKLMGELARQQDEAVKEYETMLAEWHSAKSLIGAARYRPVESMLEASLADARVWRLDAQAFANFLLGKDYAPQLAEMRRLAAENKGTRLVGQRIDGVLRSYNRRPAGGPE